MRVAIFTESYEPIVNGVSVSVATLRDGLRARGHEVFVFAPKFPGYDDGGATFRFPSIVSRVAPDYPVPLPWSMENWHDFRKVNPDIVHTHSPFFLGLAGMRWGRRIGVPVVSTNHTLYVEYLHYLPFIPPTMTKAVLLGHMKHYYTRCDAVVTPSRVVEQVLRSYGIKNNIEVIGSGIAAGRSKADRGARSRYGISEDAFVLLYVGRIAREKNLGLMLRAFQIVKQRYPHCRLMIAGSGPYEEDCMALAGNLGVADSVIFTGLLPRDELDKAYGLADLFVFPSMTETQGLVACEALVAGLPCVAVRAAANPEVMEDGVDSILTQNSVAEFSGAICSLIDDPELRDRLASGARRNAERFSVETMTEHFEKFYQAAIVRKQNKPVAVGG